MKNYFSFLLLMLLSNLIIGCKETTALKPNITGAMGEVLMVMDDKWRNSQAGETMKAMLMQPMEGLPQAEPIFNLSITPHRAFSGSMRTFRTIIVAVISPDVEKEGVGFQDESTFAKGQCIVRIYAETEEKFIELAQNNEMKILGTILKAELARTKQYYTKYNEAKLVDEVEKKWGMKMIMPNILKKMKSTSTFSWYSNETPRLSQGLLIYSYDYLSEESLSKEYILNKRDSVLKANVPGAPDGSYMTTEHDVPITHKAYQVNNHYTAELRGLWKVQGDLMGGPFVLLAHLDYENSRVVVTDSYVYYPEEPKKRNYVWQMETLMNSVVFPKDQKSNKEKQ